MFIPKLGSSPLLLSFISPPTTHYYHNHWLPHYCHGDHPTTGVINFTVGKSNWGEIRAKDVQITEPICLFPGMSTHGEYIPNGRFDGKMWRQEN